MIKANGKVIYFAHVPKCGGTSVEKYLRKRYGPVAFRDPTDRRSDVAAHWSRSSPQHVDGATLARLFPEDFFDAKFAVVRHPVARMVSVYNHHFRDLGGAAPNIGFGDWLTEMTEQRMSDPYLLDNHLRPICDFVTGDTYEIFRLEDGLDPVAAALHDILDYPGDPGRIGHHNKRAGPLRPEELSEAECALVADIYAGDFAKFGYSTAERAGAITRPAKPKKFARLFRR